MSIGAVNFRGTTSFQERIQQPQAYTRTEQPVASQSINYGEKPSNTGKKILIAAATAGATAALLGLGHSKGWLKQNPEGSKLLNKIKSPLDTVGGWVCTGAEKVKNFVMAPFTDKDKKGAENLTNAPQTPPADPKMANATAGQAPQTPPANPKMTDVAGAQTGNVTPEDAQKGVAEVLDEATQKAKNAATTATTTTTTTATTTPAPGTTVTSAPAPTVPEPDQTLTDVVTGTVETAANAG